jgi:hypothetical protein
VGFKRRPDHRRIRGDPTGYRDDHGSLPANRTSYARFDLHCRWSRCAKEPRGEGEGFTWSWNGWDPLIKGSVQSVGRVRQRLTRLETIRRRLAGPQSEVGRVEVGRQKSLLRQPDRLLDDAGQGWRTGDRPPTSLRIRWNAGHGVNLPS